MSDERDLRERLEEVLVGYFDLRTTQLIERVVAAASVERLQSDEGMDALFAAFVEVLDERYGRDDPGWAPAARGFLRTEFDRQVAAHRALVDAIEAEDG